MFICFTIVCFLFGCERTHPWIKGELLEYGTISEALADKEQEDTAALDTGAAELGFEGFSSGWYIFDDGIPYETTSNPNYQVTYHGDPDLYWYEPSGAHGLINSSNSSADFAALRNYVLALAPEPVIVTEPLQFNQSSSLNTFEFATFTYIMCDFRVDANTAVSRYAISGGAVDDGIQIMLNGEILGRRVLNEGAFSWPLSTAKTSGVNTLIIILVDDSASNKYVHDLAFTLDGEMVH